ncbi:unnamed protein product [Caenorhabditis sp. 36 PRJEB53466]|nr:unnamed protein product [Caenorhabditis sp. 36 PRJEB53466]
MHNPLKKLSRSISHKLLGKRANDSSSESFSSASSTTSSTATTPQQNSIDEDPYREILRSYEDNVSHLVYHGSSLRSMTSLDLRKSPKSFSDVHLHDKNTIPKRPIVIPMNRLCLTTLFVSASVLAQDPLRKVSGDAAPDKAQEPIDIDDFIPTIDSSVRFDALIPEPPALVVSLPMPPASQDVPQPPASNPVAPPSSQVSPPSVDIDDILPEPIDDLEEFQKADLLEIEKKAEVKDLVRKTTLNRTDDYYITSPATTVTSELQSDTVGESDVSDFDKLLDKKMTTKEESATTVQEELTTESSTERSTTTPSTTSPTTTTSVSTTTEILKKTCIDVKELKKVDDSVKAGTRTGTIEVSVEVGEDSEEDDDASEEEETAAPVRNARENKQSVVWKKFEMNCDEEEDEKGTICKLWAAGGLCGTHKPTMFLFCRKTCLCVGPN